MTELMAMNEAENYVFLDNEPEVSEMQLDLESMIDALLADL